MKNPFYYLDDLLNGVTMYRMLTYGLTTIIAITIVFGFTNVLHISGLAILFSTVTLLVVCYVVNKLLGVLWNAQTNAESFVITALILALILPPSTSLHGLSLIALAGILAMASKFILAIRHRHIFNPAAFAALVLSFGGVLPAIWWVGSPVMLLLISLYSLFVLRKVRKFQLFFSFALSALIIACIIGTIHGQMIAVIVRVALASSPLIFLGAIMLTEPETLPASLLHQRIYGVLVGVLFTSQLNFGFISATPEVALIIGNIYAYIVGTKYKARLLLRSIKPLAPHIYELSFLNNPKLAFTPGQYVEWTLPHGHMDSRGNRRTFSLISTPCDDEIRFTIRTSDRGSSFKKALLEMGEGSAITAGHVSGSFILPKDRAKKLVFVAGGIGVTPYVSMINSLVQRKEVRDIILFYIVSAPEDYCYTKLWEQAKVYGVTVIPVLSGSIGDHAWEGLLGRLTEQAIIDSVPAYKARDYYLSGPNALVNTYKSLFQSFGIRSKDIHTDHFSGY